MSSSAVFLYLPVLASFLSIPVSGFVIANAPNATNDICSVLGALIASIITLIEARKKDRGVSDTISVFLGSFSVGSFLPGLLMQLAVHQGWVSEASVLAFGWQAWAFAGLVLGMNAWWILHGINRRIHRSAEAYFDKSDIDRPKP